METGSLKKEENETVHKTPKKKSKALLILNIIILSVGACGSPLSRRFYFLKGGSSIWLTSCLQTAGFPFVLIPKFIFYFNSKPTSKPYLITFPVLVHCTLLGILLGLDDFLYAYGIAYLPVSTSSLLVATQLVCTALFGFFLGTVGVIQYASALVAGIIFAVLIPVTEVLAVIFFHEKFDSGKGVALALSVWGFVSYFYGEFKAENQKKKKSIVLKEACIIGITN